MPAKRQPLQQAIFRRREIGVADTHGLEAQCIGPSAYLLGQRVIIYLMRNPALHVHDDSLISINLADEDATAELARRLSKCIRPGMVIYLHGDLGAGKTTLVRGILRALGYSGRVKSPTYTLVEPYHIAESGLDIRHFDLYRLRNKEEWEAAGFRDEFDKHNIFFIEWPEHALGLIPPADLKISLEILAHGRHVKIETCTPTGRECLKPL